MSYYVEPFTFHFDTDRIVADSGTVDVDCAELYTAIKLAQASEEGIAYGQIAEGSGLVDLGPGVAVGLTVELLGDWQLEFGPGNYTARVGGGNLVGGPSGDPIAYSEGVQTLLIQSAASTVVTAGGSVPTPAQNAAAVWASLIESGLSAAALQRILLAVVAGHGTVPAGAGSFAFRDQDDTKDRVVGAVAPNGARTITAVDGS
jgi:hypothetical protein